MRLSAVTVLVAESACRGTVRGPPAARRLGDEDGDGGRRRAMRQRGGEALRTLTAAIAGGLVTGLVLAATGVLGAGDAAGAAGWPSGSDVRGLYRAAAPS